MFFQNEEAASSQGLFGQGGADTQGRFIADASTAFKNAFNFDKVQESFLSIENSAKEMSRTVFGTTGKYASSIQKTLLESYKSTLDIGGTLKDQADTYKAISSALQRQVYLQDEQLAAAVRLQKTTGISAEELGTLVVGFQNLGQSTGKALESVDGLAASARGYGLNVNTFLKKVGENIKLVNSYGFKDGVEGLGRMVARAQALRMDFTKVTALAADLLNPEKAIELAASFQTLGGEIGALGDPFKLMYMAENDMEGLQNAIVDTAKSAVMFNKETGEFKITGVEMRRLREQAQALNMSYEDLANTAVKAAKEQEVMSRLEFTGLNEKQKQLVANLAEINKNGEVQLTFPGLDGVTRTITDFTNISAEDQQAIEQFQKDNAKSAEQIQIEQLSLARKRNIALEKISTTGLISSGIVDPTQQLNKDLTELTKATVEGTTKGFVDNMSSFFSEGNFNKVFGSFIAGSDQFITDAANLVGTTAQMLQTIAVEIPNNMNTLMSSTNQFNSAVGSMTNTVNAINTSLETFFRSFGGRGGGNGGGENPDMGDDIVSTGGYGNRTLKMPKGSIQLNDLDTIVAGTNLFDNNNSSSNTSKSEQNISFNKPLEIRIDISGVNNREFETMMKSPEFTAAVRKQIMAGIGAPLGNTTAGYLA